MKSLENLAFQKDYPGTRNGLTSGLVLLIFEAPRNILKTTPHQAPPRSLKNLGLKSPLGTAIPSTLVGNATKSHANSAMNVSNADQVTTRQTPVESQPSPSQLPLHLNAPQALPTPVLVPMLKSVLKHYPLSLSNYLINGFTYGFSIHFFGMRTDFQSKNLKSADESPEVVDTKLASELQAGRIAGPFSHLPLPNFRVSPIGVVPKKAPSQYRLIHHLSFPEGSSVNDGISKEFASVQYSSVDDAIKLIKKAGTSCFLAKTDIKSAFRIIPVHPNDYHLLGFKWRGCFYYDKCLPMGCSSSCSIFETLSHALQWAAMDRGADNIVHILDDFLFISKSKAKCFDDITSFIDLCNQLGVPIAHEKTMGPASTLTFAGIELDTSLSEARLPPDKLIKCRTLLRSFLRKKSVTLLELQSLIGTLNYACIVVPPGRTFLRRLIDLSKHVHHPHHHIRIKLEAKADIHTWLEFLDSYNGRSFFLDDKWLTSDTINLYTDAAASKGFGAIFGSNWAYGEWPSDWKDLNITVLELYPVVLSVELWGSEMANKCVMFFTDNAALVEVLNRITSKDSTIMTLMRRLVLQCLNFNILFKAKHIPGKLNILADLLSRLQVSQFKSVAEGMNGFPTYIPPSLLPLNWKLR